MKNSNKTEQIREEFEKFADVADRTTCYECEGALYNKDISNWWLQKLEDQKQSLCEEIEKLKDRFHCGACDGARCEHTQCCQALDTVLSIIKK